MYGMGSAKRGRRVSLNRHQMVAQYSCYRLNILHLLPSTMLVLGDFQKRSRGYDRPVDKAY